ncbi:MAG: hypothetical protein LQ344_006584 [Seirophora lacunosa]|nr:MAG: hypothetical protein LQ344_006584 [Seirophora lacunosa]
MAGGASTRLGAEEGSQSGSQTANQNTVAMVAQPDVVPTSPPLVPTPPSLSIAPSVAGFSCGDVDTESIQRSQAVASTVGSAVPVPVPTSSLDELDSSFTEMSGSGFPVESRTLAAEGSAATVDGTLVSLAANVAIATTATLSAAASSTYSVGIMSGTSQAILSPTNAQRLANLHTRPTLVPTTPASVTIATTATLSAAASSTYSVGIMSGTSQAILNFDETLASVGNLHTQPTLVPTTPASVTKPASQSTAQTTTSLGHEGVHVKPKIKMPGRASSAAPSPSGGILTVDGLTFSLGLGADLVVATSTIRPGSPAATISGRPISLALGGTALMVGSSTVPVHVGVVSLAGNASNVVPGTQGAAPTTSFQGSKEIIISGFSTSRLDVPGATNTSTVVAFTGGSSQSAVGRLGWGSLGVIAPWVLAEFV